MGGIPAENLPEEDVKLLEEYAYRAKVAPWTVYPLTSLPAIQPWHESTSRIRVLSGPNRGGKTTAGAFELVSYATGFNPIRNEHYTTPNVTWGVCLTMKDQGKIMLRKLMEMLPRLENGRPNWRYWKQEGLIVLGKPYFSEIYIKQQQDGRESFYGEGCTAIWIDEGKSGETGKENFDEMLIREIPGQPLQLLITLTPLNGADWLWQRVWNEKSPDYIKGTFKCRFEAKDTLIENGGFWTPEQIDSREQLYDDLQRDARMKGLWVSFSNKLFFNGRRLLKALERVPVAKRVKPLFRSMEECEDGIANLYRPRESGHSYLSVWDPSSGVGGDNSAFVVLDRSDLAIVFQCARNDMDPELYYHQVVFPASTYYNESLLVIEINGEGGGAAIQAASEYPNLYTQKVWDKLTATLSEKLGWRTLGGEGGNRGRILDSLLRALREDKWTPTHELLQEMSHIVVKVSDSGKKKVEHEDGYHDDLAMATGIGLCVHWEEPPIEYPDWNRLRVAYHKQGEQHVPQRFSSPVAPDGSLSAAEQYEQWRQGGKQELPI